MNSVPRQTVPDFQETRPRNYILSASASAVSTPRTMPCPTLASLAHSSCYWLCQCGTRRQQVSQRALLMLQAVLRG